jgi:hypothetical protein
MCKSIVRGLSLGGDTHSSSNSAHSNFRSSTSAIASSAANSSEEPAELSYWEMHPHPHYAPSTYTGEDFANVRNTTIAEYSQLMYDRMETLL